MRNSYILVEGINLYSNLFDTTQLSVIRGTSFLFKEAINSVSEAFKNRMESISSGASSGLFLLKENQGQQHSLVQDITDYLNDENKAHSLLTFIVEKCEADDLITAKETLYTQLRIKQMKSTILVPDRKTGGNFPDQLEGRRIAENKNKRKVQGEERILSTSVCTRLDYGRKLRQSIYFKSISDTSSSQSDELSRLNDLSFCDDFETLANNQDFRKLNNKIAVIYIDGNHFSKKQRKFINKADNQIQAQRDFDKKIQSCRNDFLQKTLLEMSQNPDMFLINAEGEKQIRLETLLWGGDEMLFVMPAWAGFDFLQQFFHASRDWQLQGLNAEDKSLTHAAGIVFCHAKTPIQYIRKLAQIIADNIKEENRTDNTWGYMVLESIDYPTSNNLDDFNNSYYGDTLSATKPAYIRAYTEDDYHTIKTSANELFNNKQLAISQLYKIIQSLVGEQQNHEAITLNWDEIRSKTRQEINNCHLFEQCEYRLFEVATNADELIKHLKHIATLFGLDINKPQERIWLWIYLYELRHYLSPELSPEKQQGDTTK